MRSYAILSLGALARLAHGAVFDVVAGASGLTYTPTSVNAAVGDELHIHYMPGPHSFEESDFASPCTYKSGGISSGTISSNSGEASQMFVMRVNDTDPHWMFCGTPGHCGAGMAFVLNPPASGNTLQAYISAASGKSGSGSSSVVGGFLAANVDNGPALIAGSSSSSASGSSSSSASSASSASSGSTSTATGTATAAVTTSAGGSATSTGSSPIATDTGNAASNFAVVPLMLLAPAAAYFFS